MRKNLIWKCSVFLLAISALSATSAVAGYNAPLSEMGPVSMKITRKMQASGVGDHTQIFFANGHEVKTVREMKSAESYCVFQDVRWDLKREYMKVDAGTIIKMHSPDTAYLDEGGVEFFEDTKGTPITLECEGLPGEDATLEDIRKIVGDSILFSVYGEPHSQVEPSTKSVVNALADVSATLQDKGAHQEIAYDRNHAGRADEAVEKAGATKPSTSEAAI